MAPDRLDRRQLNRALLARQLLLERSTMSPVDALEHLVGMQAQAPLAPYVGLWSRLTAFDPNVLGAAVERGDVVRTHTFRVTVHLHTASDAKGMRGLLQPVLTRRFASTPFARELVGVDLAEVVRLGRELAHDPPLSRVELGRRLGEHFPGVAEAPLAYAVTHLVPMVQTPPRGVWGRRAPVTWQTFDGWCGDELGDSDAGRAPAATVDDAALRYLAAFGPAGVADMRVWSALPGLGEVADRLRPQLRTYVDEDGRELLDHPDAPRPPPDVPAPVRFLPEYDNVLLSHADRRRVIPDGRRVPLPPGDGARAGTVLVDGDLRATWVVTRDGGSATLRVSARPALPAAEEIDVTQEAERLLALVAPDATDRRVECWVAES
jgi:hypothetical protein